MKKRRKIEGFYNILNAQSIKDYDHSFLEQVIPYTIEEALEDLRDGEVEIIQYTIGSGSKRLTRFNQRKNCFESRFPSSNGADWFKEQCSYLRMKTWEDIGIYEEEYEKNRDIILSALGGFDLRKLKEELKILEIDCLFREDVDNHIFYFFIKKAKDEEKIRKYILPSFFTFCNQCEIVHIDNVINNL